jgi:hypothetical protein
MRHANVLLMAISKSTANLNARLNGQQRFWDAAFCAALAGLVNRRLKPGYVAHRAAEYADAAVFERSRRNAR